MIPIKLQIILFVISIVALLFFGNMIRKYKLELKYALTWMLLILSFIFVSLFPKILLWSSSFLSIETPVNTLFLLGIFSCLILIFSLTVSLSRSSTKIKLLSQELGLLKQTVEKQLQKKNGERNENDQIYK